MRARATFLAARRPRSPWTKRTVVVVTLATTFAAGAPAALASFLDDATASSAFTAALDWVAPQASASVIAKAIGYLAGPVKQGGSYYLYANVTDTGNPSSGVAWETADASATTSGASTTTLTAGSWSVNGVIYNYRSAALGGRQPALRRYQELLGHLHRRPGTAGHRATPSRWTTPPPPPPRSRPATSAGAPPVGHSWGTPSPSPSASRSIPSRSCRGGRGLPPVWWSG